MLKRRWQEHRIDLQVDFAWFRPDGSSFSDSADPRHDQTGALVLSRVE